MVNIHEANPALSALLARVEQGEEIVIARNGQPIAKLVGIKPHARRVPGAWKALPGWESFTDDPALFAPMSDAEIATEGWL